jgi:S1-C subfamily serine protease
VNAIYTRSRDSVRFIQATVVQEQQSPFGFPESQQGISTGTGFVIDDDNGLANRPRWHSRRVLVRGPGHRDLDLRPGDSVEIACLRDGERRAVRVPLGAAG